MSVILQQFNPVDQIVFFAFIAIGAFVGVYFAYFAPKANHQEANYLFGGRNMKTIPVALSLLASYISGLTLIAMPAEVYLYGMQLAWASLTQWLIVVLYNSQFLPVFHGLKGLSMNEYFERRFDKRLRLLVSVLFFASSICFLPVVMFVPSLAYEQSTINSSIHKVFVGACQINFNAHLPVAVTGFNKYWVTVCVCIVCIFYTSVGGLKAVVWTDAIQVVFMFAWIALVIVKGTYDIGPSAIWQRNVSTERIELPYVDFDPTVRQTIFSVTIGAFIMRLRAGYLTQWQIQRHQSLPTIGHAKRATWLMLILQVTVQLACMYIGLVVYAFYFKCDPITIKVVSAKDQILPLYVMQTIGQFPGLTGIFLAGVFSGALSTTSTLLNTLSGVFVEDWIRGHTRWNPSEREATWIMRIFVVVIGLIGVCLVFVVSHLGTLLQLVQSVDAIFGGAILTIFFTAVFIPWATSLGALVGAAAAVASIAPVVIGTQYSVAKRLIHFPTKPFSVEGCTQLFNVTSEFVSNTTLSKPAIPYGSTRGEVWYPLRISHNYFLPLSIACGVLATVLVTVFTSKTDLRKLDRRLVAPISRRWLPNSAEQSTSFKHRIVLRGEDAQRMQPIEMQLNAEYQ